MSVMIHMDIPVSIESNLSCSQERRQQPGDQPKKRRSAAARRLLQVHESAGAQVQPNDVAAGVAVVHTVTDKRVH